MTEGKGAGERAGGERAGSAGDDESDGARVDIAAGGVAGGDWFRAAERVPGLPARPTRGDGLPPCHPTRWTRAMKATFFDHLAATCNVKGAAHAAGVEPATVYRLRRSDPAFAAAWSEALEMGYEMLETLMVGHALAGGGRVVDTGATRLPGSDVAVGPINVDIAFRLLTNHAADRRPRRYGKRPQVAAPEEVDAVILRKLKQVSERLAARARQEARIAGPSPIIDQPRIVAPSPPIDQPASAGAGPADDGR